MSALFWRRAATDCAPSPHQLSPPGPPHTVVTCPPRRPASFPGWVRPAHPGPTPGHRHTAPQLDREGDQVICAGWQLLLIRPSVFLSGSSVVCSSWYRQSHGWGRSPGRRPAQLQLLSPPVPMTASSHYKQLSPLFNCSHNPWPCLPAAPA